MSTDIKHWQTMEIEAVKKDTLLNGFMAPTATAIVASILFLIVLAGCGGGAGTVVNTELHIPDLDRTMFNDSQYEAGWKALKAGKPRAALEHFQNSSAADEKLFVGYGYSYMAMNKFALAQKNLQKSLAINPDNLQAQFGMATIHETLKEAEQAFLIYARLRTRYPENAWVKVRYDFIKSTETQKYLEEAEKYKNQYSWEPYIEALKRASQFSPEIIDIKIEVADFYKQQQKYDLSAKEYEAVLEKLPNREDILLKLAEVYEDGQKFDAAVLIYKKMLEIKPGDLDLTNKVNQLKMKFFNSNLPTKFKNIFFKDELTREELAAFIGYYFNKYLEPRPPVIITDIGGSFAKKYIIRVCTLGIMKLRPDHSFGRFPIIKRAEVAVVLNALIKYLEKSDSGAYTIQFTPMEEIVEPTDISPLHRHYKTIKFLVNSRILKLDNENKFNPTQHITPTRVQDSIKKILNSIKER